MHCNLTPAEESMGAWYDRLVYGVWCLIGVIGVVVSFSKVGFDGFLGAACNGAVFMLALNFLVKARRTVRLPQQSALFIRSGFLMALALMPMTWKCFGI
jgi:hypothetical protein